MLEVCIILSSICWRCGAGTHSLNLTEQVEKMLHLHQLHHFFSAILLENQWLRVFNII